MTLSGGKANDIGAQAAALALPFNDGRLACLACVEKSADAHNEPQFAHADVHVSGLVDFVMRAIINERRQATDHTGLLKIAEQGGKEPKNLMYVNALALLKLSCRPNASGARQAVGALSQGEAI